jgi:hypothetical protein
MDGTTASAHHPARRLPPTRASSRICWFGNLLMVYASYIKKKE